MKALLIVICSFLLFAGLDPTPTPTPKNEPAPPHVCKDTTHQTCDGVCDCDGYCNE